MAKRPQDMSLDELAQEMNKREDSLDHLTAKAEITRRQTAAQLDATRATTRNANYMLASVIRRRDRGSRVSGVSLFSRI